MTEQGAFWSCKAKSFQSFIATAPLSKDRSWFNLADLVLNWGECGCECCKSQLVLATKAIAWRLRKPQDANDALHRELQMLMAIGAELRERANGTTESHSGCETTA